MKTFLFFFAAALAITTGAMFALAGCGCSDTDSKKAETVKDAISLPEDVTPVSLSGDATVVSVPDAVTAGDA
tara:strand:+ start:217 stop:432 length:216 start_codon:yes stop_codon:yes gene_type:complete